MKIRKTVNNLNISYNEDTDEITFEKNDVILTLKMGEDNLNLLYKETPYPRYRNDLLKKQNYQCADCRKDLKWLSKENLHLHHDPPLGSKGAKYIDSKELTKNRLLCIDCHNKLTMPTKSKK